MGWGGTRLLNLIVDAPKRNRDPSKGITPNPEQISQISNVPQQKCKFRRSGNADSKIRKEWQISRNSAELCGRILFLGFESIILVKQSRNVQVTKEPLNLLRILLADMQNHNSSKADSQKSLNLSSGPVLLKAESQISCFQEGAESKK